MTKYPSIATDSEPFSIGVCEYLTHIVGYALAFEEPADIVFAEKESRPPVGYDGLREVITRVAHRHMTVHKVDYRKHACGLAVNAIVEGFLDSSANA